MEQQQEQAEYHKEMIELCQEDIDYYWDRLDAARFNLRRAGTVHIDDDTSYEPKDVVEFRQRLQCLGKWKQDHEEKLRKLEESRKQ